MDYRPNAARRKRKVGKKAEHARSVAEFHRCSFWRWRVLLLHPNKRCLSSWLPTIVRRISGLSTTQVVDLGNSMARRPSR